MLLSVAAASVSFHGLTHSMPSSMVGTQWQRQKQIQFGEKKIPDVQMNTLINSKASDTNLWCVSQNVGAWGGGMRTNEKGSEAGC